MMSFEKVLSSDRLMRALTGMSASGFTALLPEFAAVWEAARIRAYHADPDHTRKPGSGRKGSTGTIPEKLFFILLYYKCYPTCDMMSFLYGCDRSNVCRKQ